MFSLKSRRLAQRNRKRKRKYVGNGNESKLPKKTTDITSGNAGMELRSEISMGLEANIGYTSQQKGLLSVYHLKKKKGKRTKTLRKIWAHYSVNQ